MVLLNFLRALADLGFYYAIAGLFSGYAGGCLALETFLLQSACFALSFALRRSRCARLAALVPALLPALLSFRLGIPAADVIVSLPPAVYLAYLAWMDNYQLSWYYQVDIFKIFCKVFLYLLCVLCWSFWRQILTVGIPAALVMAGASALLMRSLRHEPVVFLQPGYQLVNFSGIALVVTAALVIGSEIAVRAATFLLGSFGNYVIAPLLTGVAIVIGLIAIQFWPLIQWLVSRFLERRAAQLQDGDLSSFSEQVRKLNPYGSGGELIARIFFAAVILLTIAILVLFFFLLSRREKDIRGASRLSRAAIPARRNAWDENGYARRIRRQYRAFLRLCQKEGLQFAVSDTSTDISEEALREFPDEAALSGLRDLYQEARYHGVSSREDYQQFKHLLGSLKKLPIEGAGH